MFVPRSKTPWLVGTEVFLETHHSDFGAAPASTICHPQAHTATRTRTIASTFVELSTRKQSLPDRKRTVNRNAGQHSLLATGATLHFQKLTRVTRSGGEVVEDVGVSVDEILTAGLQIRVGDGGLEAVVLFSTISVFAEDAADRASGCRC